MLKAAIIGLGNAGFLYDYKIDNQILTHFKAYNNSKYINLECASDVDVAKCKKFHTITNLPVYEDYTKMFECHNVDIVSIASNNESHVKILKDLLSYNLKYVFCEKPLSNDLEGLNQVHSDYKKRKIPIYVNYFRKWDKEFIKIGSIIKKTKQDDLVKIEINYTKGLIHTGTHYLDFLIDWLGLPIAWSKPIPIERINEHDFTSSFDLFFNFKGKKIIVKMIGEKLKKNQDMVTIFFKKTKIQIIGARIVNYYKIINNNDVIQNSTNTDFDIIIMNIINHICGNSHNSDLVVKDNFRQSYKVLEYALKINKPLF